MNPTDMLARLKDPQQPPVIVAELSGNHGGKLETALALVDAAAEAGADAIKLQTYTADAMTLPLTTGEFTIQEPQSLWHGRSLHELYAQAATPREWHEMLFQRARERGMLAFSSPFDASAVDFLVDLGCPWLKIASFELTDLPLIRCAAGTGKPLILSTGMATLAEIEEAVCAARSAGAHDILLLKCSSRYPASADHCHLLTLEHMSAAFNCPVGFSDHTVGEGSAAAAVALGARLIEKHLVLDRDSDQVDAAFSSDPDSLRRLVAGCREAWASRGRVTYGNGEDASERKYRRSLYIARDLKAGERLTPETLRVVRPGSGLSPRYYELLLGKRVRADVAAGTPLNWTHVLE